MPLSLLVAGLLALTEIDETTLIHYRPSRKLSKSISLNGLSHD
jgi:hypothetical protein